MNVFTRLATSLFFSGHNARAFTHTNRLLFRSLTNTPVRQTRILSSSKPPEFHEVYEDGNVDNQTNDIDWGGDNDSTYAGWDKETTKRESIQVTSGGTGRRKDYSRTTGRRINYSRTTDRRKDYNRDTKNTDRKSVEPESTSFKDDFRGTRVFVQGLPLDTDWQELKDHFRTAGEVVFASVSQNADGSSKGCGVVQYETSAEARKATKCMRDHPLNGATLFVREDVKEDDGGRSFDPGNKGRERRDAVPVWRCADDDDEDVSEKDRVSPSQKKAIEGIIRGRDAARRRRDYKSADDTREELKVRYGVHLDDRLKLWWSARDNAVPRAVADLKGEGGWDKKAKPWRQIPTTPENDATVDSDAVNDLLRQRDMARRKKDFSTADALLEDARSSPDGGLYLRIHDESRTWRIWTDEPPPRQDRVTIGPAEECLDLVEKYDPEKLEEMKKLLEAFPGREYNILRKIKARYLE